MAMFLDKAKIKILSGKGGNGAVAWRREKYVDKGRQIAVQGKIQTGSYEKNDGTRVYTTDIIVDSFYFADSKQGGQAQGNYRAQPQQTTQPQQGAASDLFSSIDDDSDLPF